MSDALDRQDERVQAEAAAAKAKPPQPVVLPVAGAAGVGAGAHAPDAGGRDHAPNLAESTPVARMGVLVMGGLLAIVLVTGIVRNGLLQALGDLGFRSPAIAAYTLMLLSPLLFESLYPRLRRNAAGKRAKVLDNLHLHAPYLILIGIVMLVMRLENIFDLDIEAALGLDWTATVFGIEGDTVARLQEAMRSPALDLWFHFIYVTVYALYHVVAMVGFAATGRTALVKRFAVTWVLVYAIALPFYILAPVNEVWFTNPEYDCYGDGAPPADMSNYDSKYGSFATDTEGILHDGCGEKDGIVYAISSINNCFPSLHNAFAWALPLLLWKSGRRKASLLTSLIAVNVTVSTVYLGIHWITDIVAGVTLAWVVTSIAVRFQYRLDRGLRIRDAKWGPPTKA